MILLNRKADYALLILCYLHHHAEEGGCARAIAEQFNLSRAFVANILKVLCHRGFVTSIRGQKGGYFLRQPATQTTLADLLDSLDDPLRLAECTGPKPEECCHLTAACPVRGPIAEVNRRLRDVLEGVTLAEIFQAQAPVECVELTRDGGSA